MNLEELKKHSYEMIDKIEKCNASINKEKSMKIGYKGMNSDMICREVKFEVGKSYFIDDNKNVKSTDVVVDINYENKYLELCSKDVFHYCNNLQDVNTFYTFTGQGNRFFKIQILGAWTDANDKKSGTTSFRILEELTGANLEKELLIGKRDSLDQRLGLEELRNLQKVFPTLIIGGSVSLYLRGYYLKRFSNWDGDYDLSAPYWIDLSEYYGVEDSDEDKSDGNDFDDTFYINNATSCNRKIDLCVDPHQKYETITYKGEKYKVALIIDVIEAKARYARQKGGQKHLQDLTELMSQNKQEYGDN